MTYGRRPLQHLQRAGVRAREEGARGIGEAVAVQHTRAVAVASEHDCIEHEAVEDGRRGAAVHAKHALPPNRGRHAVERAAVAGATKRAARLQPDLDEIERLAHEDANGAGESAAQKLPRCLARHRPQRAKSWHFWNSQSR